MAEAFNLFNRRNYSSLNNTFGADPAGLNNCNPFLPPAQFRGANAGLTDTSSPFSYTAVDPMRELFGVRFSF